MILSSAFPIAEEVKISNYTQFLIETERLEIRPLSTNDIDSLVPILHDSDTMLYTGGSKNRGEAIIQLHQWIADYESDGFGFMAFIDKCQNNLIGYGGFLHQVVEGQKYIELGYAIAKEYWNNGYATEATAALKEYGLNSLNFSELISIIHENNRASSRVASKIGMTLLKKVNLEDNPCLIYHCNKE